MIDNLRMVNALNQLLAVCQESKQRCQAVADKVDHSEVREWCVVCARHYAQFVAALRAEVCFHGGNPHSTMSKASAGSHNPIDITTVLSSGDVSSILAACRDGEAATLATYEAVQQVGMPHEVQSMVRRQHRAIQDAYEHLQMFEAHLHAHPVEEPAQPDLQNDLQSDVASGICSLSLN